MFTGVVLFINIAVMEIEFVGMERRNYNKGEVFVSVDVRIN